MDLVDAKHIREERDLAPYAMKSRQSRGRVHPETEDHYRTCFERDRDRIIHSTAFRRLEYKTQVFVNHEGDYYRTRLTHSLEVVQVARSLAGALRINEALVEALGLAHDLGHPPFGHAGEDVLDDLMKKYGGFRHNRQVLRIVDLLEKRSPAYDGLNLSYEVRESLLKSEKHRAPEAEAFELTKQYLLEAQIVDLADSTAYNHHDVDDGLKAEILKEDQLDTLALWRRARKEAEKNYPGLSGPLRERRILNSMFGICIHDLIRECQRRIEQLKLQSPQDVRNASATIADHSEDLSTEVAELQRFLHRHFYRSEKVQKEIRKSRKILEGLFIHFVEDPEKMPPEWRNWCEKQGVHRAVCDYIAGMTDRYALEQEKTIHR